MTALSYCSKTEVYYQHYHSIHIHKAILYNLIRCTLYNIKLLVKYRVSSLHFNLWE